MRRHFFYLIFSVFFAVNVAAATIVSRLNIAMVPVNDTSLAARQIALPKALSQVLVKLSGNPKIMTVPMIQEALGQVNQLIQSYDYLNQTLADHSSQLILRVTFNETALKQLLRNLGQANWSDQRLLTLMWIQMVSHGNAMVLSSTNDMHLSQEVQKTAQLRGVPILFPTMDLQDQSFISSKDPFNRSLLQQAVMRYGADAILGGYVRENNHQWQGRWFLLAKGVPYQWGSKADSIEILLQDAVNDMANLMANQLAMVDDQALQSDVILQVNQVENLEDYVTVLSKLRRLTSVAKVTTQKINDSSLLLCVRVAGGEQALSNALASESHFVALNRPDTLEHQADLWYRWRR